MRNPKYVKKINEIPNALKDTWKKMHRKPLKCNKNRLQLLKDTHRITFEFGVCL